MITDSVQSMMAMNVLPQLRPVIRKRLVEALAAVDRDTHDGVEAAPQGIAERVARASENAAGTGATEGMHFIYRMTRENGRRVAKRTPQLTDTRYWSMMFDRAG
jgi:hypothetical protein